VGLFRIRNREDHRVDRRRCEAAAGGTRGRQRGARGTHLHSSRRDARRKSLHAVVYSSVQKPLGPTDPLPRPSAFRLGFSPWLNKLDQVYPYQAKGSLWIHSTTTRSSKHCCNPRDRKRRGTSLSGSWCMHWKCC